MAHFDRFDICAAYLALETDWNKGGHIPERTARQAGKRAESIGVQLSRMAFDPGRMFNGWESLTENGRAIYDAACERLRLGDGGYKDCACRDCFEIAIGWGRPMCNECQEAGCGPNRECSREPDPEEDD
jgi:hypothetical protein